MGEKIHLHSLNVRANAWVPVFGGRKLQIDTIIFSYCVQRKTPPCLFGFEKTGKHVCFRLQVIALFVNMCCGLDHLCGGY